MKLTYFFQVGQRVKFHNTDFDAVKKIIDCVVKEVHDDHLIVTTLDTCTDLWIEEGLNLHQVFPLTKTDTVNLSEMSVSEIFVNLDDYQRQAIFQMIAGDKIEDDVLTLLETEEYAKYGLEEDDMEIIANSVKNEFIYNGHINLDNSYWENIKFLIKTELEG